MARLQLGTDNFFVDSRIVCFLVSLVVVVAVVLLRVLSGLETGNGQSPRSRSLELAHRGHGSDRGPIVPLEMIHALVVSRVRVAQVDIGRWLWIVTLGLDET